MPINTPLVHLTTRDAWEEALKTGAYTAPSLKTEGFIHCSLPGQVATVANTWFAGQAGLLLLVIDPTRLKSEVRMEPGTDKPDELFPHIYGLINLEAVIQVINYEPGENGRFVRPEIK